MALKVLLSRLLETFFVMGAMFLQRGIILGAAFDGIRFNAVWTVADLNLGNRTEPGLDPLFDDGDAVETSQEFVQGL